MNNNYIFNVREVADIVDGEIVGDSNIKIFALNRIENSCSGELTFFDDRKYEDHFLNSKASCIIVNMNYEFKEKDGIAYIKVNNPYKSFVEILKYISSKIESKNSFIHASAVIDNDTDIDNTAYIGPYCVIGKGCSIGANVVLNAKVTLYDNVSINKGTVLNSGVVCYQDIVIGENCILHSGAVIGADGFGYIENNDGSFDKIPQLGNVVLENDVEIGANTTIDRAIVGSTIIKRGVKLDNLCQIGHNVELGEDSAVVAQAGVAGSSKIGKRNRIGGQVGIAGHLEIADDVIILAQSGVAKTVDKKGIYFGSPIRDRLSAFKIQASLTYLPEMVRKFKTMIKSIEELQKKIR